MNLEQIAHAIHAQEGDLKPHVRLIDPHMDKENVLGGFNVRKELMRYGVFCQRANSDPSLGKQRIRKALQLQYNKITGSEDSLLKVSRDCSHTIFEFQHYIWGEYRRNPEEFSPKEQPKKKFDHFMDCLRYIYNADPRYIVPEDDDVEVEYTGEYVKYPTKKVSGSGSAYRDLIEGG